MKTKQNNSPSVRPCHSVNTCPIINKRGRERERERERETTPIEKTIQQNKLINRKLEKKSPSKTYRPRQLRYMIKKAMVK